MKLTINGQQLEVAENATIYEILQQLKIEDRVMAVAVNMEIVKKDSWDSFVPNEGDKIEFLEFVGGG